MSDESSNPQLQDYLEGNERELLKQIQEVWSLEELEQLDHLMKSRDFLPFFKYLRQLERYLEKQVWQCKSFDQYRFVCGQMDATVRLLRAQEEIRRMRDAAKVVSG